MPNSTNFSEVAKPTTNFSKVQKTAGTRKIYNSHTLYDDHTFYNGQIVLSETEDGSTDHAQPSINSTNFS